MREDEYLDEATREKLDQLAQALRESHVWILRLRTQKRRRMRTGQTMSNERSSDYVDIAGTSRRVDAWIEEHAG